jgi:hypothetical protein
MIRIKFTSPSGSENPYGTSSASPYLFQNLMVPTFAPGIFFNTIKSGVAVDYPLINSNITIANSYVTSSGGNYYINAGKNDILGTSVFDSRVPFEALVEPEKHLAGSPVYCNEPHLYANNSGSVSWNGDGNNRYKLMANNFLAETTEFFMREKDMTQISSLPSNDPNVGQAVFGKTYMMRVKMYKSTDQATIPNVSSSGGFYTPPQYGSSSRVRHSPCIRAHLLLVLRYMCNREFRARMPMIYSHMQTKAKIMLSHHHITMDSLGRILLSLQLEVEITPFKKLFPVPLSVFHRYAPTDDDNDEFFRSLRSSTGMPWT